MSDCLLVIDKSTLEKLNSVGGHDGGKSLVSIGYIITLNIIELKFIGETCATASVNANAKSKARLCGYELASFGLGGLTKSNDLIWRSSLSYGTILFTYPVMIRTFPAAPNALTASPF